MGIVAGVLMGAAGAGGEWVFKKAKDKLKNWLAKKVGNDTITNEDEQIIDSIFMEYQQELTDRLKIDMKSDSWLSKNIRPMVLLLIVISFPGFAIYAPEATLVIETYKWWGSAGIAFYFGSRMLEKYAAIKKG